MVAESDFEGNFVEDFYVPGRSDVTTVFSILIFSAGASCCNIREHNKQDSSNTCFFSVHVTNETGCKTLGKPTWRMLAFCYHRLVILITVVMPQCVLTSFLLLRPPLLMKYIPPIIYSPWASLQPWIWYSLTLLQIMKRTSKPSHIIIWFLTFLQPMRWISLTFVWVRAQRERKYSKDKNISASEINAGTG